MKKFIELLERTLLPVAEKIEANRYLRSISEGFTSLTPFFIIGSIYLLLSNIPFDFINDFANQVLGEGSLDKLGYVLEATFNVMALLGIIGMARSLLDQYDIKDTSAQILPVVTFLLLNTFTVEVFSDEGISFVIDGAISTEYLGAPGLFVAIISTIITVEAYRCFKHKGWTIKLPSSVPPAVGNSFAALIPSAIILTVTLAIKIAFQYTDFHTIFTFIYTLLQQPLVSLGNTLPSQMICEGFISLFWCFGIHGDNVVTAVWGTVWGGLSAQNLLNVQAGLDPVNIITQQFRDVYLIAGGTGCTLSLLVCIFWKCKSNTMRAIAKIAGPAAIFNINEPVIFGIPIVLNPIMMVPFIIVPAVLCVTTYVAMSTGLVPLTQGIEIPWTTPVFLSGLIAGGWRAVILQAINFIIAILIYYPFVTTLDKKYLDEEAANEEALKGKKVGISDSQQPEGAIIKQNKENQKDVLLQEGILEN